MPEPDHQTSSDTDELSKRLLPRSGVGVLAPWLVIAPAGNPVIRIDLRLLDSVEILDSDEYEERDPSEDAEERERRRADVVLMCGDLDVAMYIADGPEAAMRIVREAAPLTRRNAGCHDTSAAQPSPSVSLGERATSGDAKLIILSSHHPEYSVREPDELAGRSFDLAQPEVTIGRTDDNEIALDHESVSGKHARITRDPETWRYTLHDLESTNGVRVNGEPHAIVELRHFDVIDLGHVRMRFVEAGGDLPIPRDAPADLEHMIVVGRDPVVQRGEFIQVGLVVAVGATFIARLTSCYTPSSSHRPT